MKKIRRIVILLLVIMTLLFSVSGCSDSDEDTSDTSTTETEVAAEENYIETDSATENITKFCSNMIIITESTSHLDTGAYAYTYIVYDENTYVMYCIIFSSFCQTGGVTITPLYMQDGTLQLYNPFGDYLYMKHY